MLRNTIIGMTAALACATINGAHAGRYEQFRERFAEGPHMTMAGATFFGGPSLEEFVGAGQLADGRIVAVGNAYPMVESDGQSYVFSVTPGGKAKQIFEMKGVGRVGVRAVDPNDGGIYWGGDRNTKGNTAAATWPCSGPPN